MSALTRLWMLTALTAIMTATYLVAIWLLVINASKALQLVALLATLVVGFITNRVGRTQPNS